MLEHIDAHLQQDIDAGRRRGRNVFGFKLAIEGLQQLPLAFSELHEDEDYNEADWYILSQKTEEAFMWYQHLGLEKVFVDSPSPSFRYLFSRVYPRLGVQYSEETGIVSNETTGQVVVARAFHAPDIFQTLLAAIAITSNDPPFFPMNDAYVTDNFTLTFMTHTAPYGSQGIFGYPFRLTQPQAHVKGLLLHTDTGVHTVVEKASSDAAACLKEVMQLRPLESRRLTQGQNMFEACINYFFVNTPWDHQPQYFQHYVRPQEFARQWDKGPS